MHNSYSYIFVIELHELHMYTISHIVGYIHYNSCNLFDSTHTCKNTLNCNELQMVVAMSCKWSLQWIANGRCNELQMVLATLKPNCKAICKSPHFFIVMFQYLYVFILYSIATWMFKLQAPLQFHVYIVSIFATFSLNLEILLYFFSFSFIGHYHIDWTINPFLLGKAFCHLQKILYCVYFMLHIWKAHYECILCN